MTLDARPSIDFLLSDPSGDGGLSAAPCAQGGIETCEGHRPGPDGAVRSKRRGCGLSPVALGRVHDFLDLHIGDHFRLKDIAQAACMSPFHFTRRFRQSLHRSPMHYVLEKRIELAKQELASGRKKIAVIACDLGFCDQSHFARSFRRLTGMSPSVFASVQAKRSGQADSG